MSPSDCVVIHGWYQTGHATAEDKVPSKKYRTLDDRVRRAVAAYGRVEILTYLRAIAHLSHT